DIAAVIRAAEERIPDPREVERVGAVGGAERTGYVALRVGGDDIHGKVLSALLAEGAHHEVDRRLQRRREAHLAGVGIALARLERLGRYRHIEGNQNGRRIEREVGAAVELVARRREIADIRVPLEGRAKDLD